MWGQKFGFVLGGALSFLFKNFSKIRSLFLHTFIVIGGLTTILIFFLGERVREGLVMVPMDGGSGFQAQWTGHLGAPFGILLFVGILIIMLSFLPYSVGVIRAVVLDETSDGAVITAIFKKRQLSYLWASIKIMLMVFVLFIPYFILLLVTMGSAFLLQGGSIAATAQNFGAGGAAAAGFGFLVIGGYIATIVAIVIFVVRWWMAPTLAALDKGTSLHESRVLTKGYWWLMILSYVVISFVVNIAVFAVIMLATLVITPLIIFLSPIVGLIMGAVAFVLVLLLAMAPAHALLGYWYLVMTNQVKFGDTKVKKVA